MARSKLDLHNDQTIKILKHMLNGEYGEGDVYLLPFEPWSFEEPTVVHKTAERERHFRMNQYLKKLEMVKEINLVKPERILWAGDRVEPSIPSQKGIDEAQRYHEKKKNKNKWKGNIKDILQKEINGWLKSVDIIDN